MLLRGAKSAQQHRKSGNHIQPLPCGMLTTGPDLVVNGGVALHAGREAGIDYGAKKKRGHCGHPIMRIRSRLRDQRGPSRASLRRVSVRRKLLKERRY